MYTGSVSAFALLLASPSLAAEAGTGDAAAADAATLAADAALDTAWDADQSGSIVVTGQRLEYGAEKSCTATRTCTDVKDIPQALTVISESQIEDQALRSIADVLTFVPGATPGTGEGNRDQITLRGNNTTADFFVNGLRDDVQYFRDLYNAERIEVLRGPNAMIFGRGGGGGIVNRVTKRASGNAYREFAMSGDSEGGVRLSGDVDLPLGGEAGLRVNGVYENGESFRRSVELERYGVNPTVGATLGGTRLDLSYEYFHDGRTADRGLPSIGGRPLRGSDRTFFGDPNDSFADVDVHLAGLAVEHGFGARATLRNRTLYGDYDKAYQNIYPTSAVAANGTLRLAAYRDTTRRKNLFSQTDLLMESDFGGFGHRLLLGFEIGRQDSVQQRLNGFFQPGDSGSLTVPAASPTVDANIIFRPVNTNAARTPSNFVDAEASVFALYAQDQIRLSESLEIVAGLRYDRFELDLTNLNNGAEFTRTDDLFSPRLGLILKPAERLSLYASYSRSYLPSSGDQFASLDLTSQALKPERFDNYEVGAKWEPVAGLLASVALYQLDRTNARAPGATPGTVVQTGEQRSRGLEIGLERNITGRWQVSGGYALQEAEIHERTSDCNPALDTCEVPLVPRHQFSMWNRFDLGSRLGLGLGLIARSKSFASISNDVVLPGYARADAAVFYELADGIEAQVNVENILGADYFPTAHNDNNIAPGAPTTARATLRFRF